MSKTIIAHGQVTKLTEEGESVSGSRIRNQAPQFAQLKRPKVNERRSTANGSRRKKKATDDVLARWLEMVGERWVVLEHGDVLGAISVSGFSSESIYILNVSEMMWRRGNNRDRTH